MKKSEIKKQKVNSKQKHSEDEEDDPKNDNSAKNEQNEVKDEVKLQQEGRRVQWFQDSNAELDQDNKWDYLQHHGVTFPQCYIPKGFKLKYLNEIVTLNAYEEELAFYWAQSMGTIYEENEIYRKNFASQFMERLTKQKPHIKNLGDFDFSVIKAYQEQQKIQRKKLSDEIKAKAKQDKAEEDKFYGYAIVDDITQKINGYQIQQPTLFKGRGKHPKAGFIKPRISPEQVSVNNAEDAPIPICSLAGHSWGEVVCKRDSTWLCSYKNDQISASSSHKYFFLAANSKFKGIKDRKKYQKARKLKNSIQRIRQSYMKMINDKDIRNRQLGTTTYIIDKLALRVGNEKGDDQADTVGCCSLRVQHIKLIENFKIQFDFLGKDSMRYHNIVTVIPQVWKNLQLFIKGKQPTDDLFNKIDAQALNDYLRELLQGLTAKVFRTYNASSTLQIQLNKYNLEGLTMEEKFEKYEEANKQVAILCNHQKTVGKKFIEGLGKKQKFIDIMKENLKELEKHKSHFSAKKDTINKQDLITNFQGKPITQKFPSSKQKTIVQLKKLQQRISREQKILKKKQQGKQIALGTSKTNYNDPRISVAWCKANQVKIQKVFTKNLLSKFLWAMYTEPDWEF